MANTDTIKNKNKTQESKTAAKKSTSTKKKNTTKKDAGVTIEVVKEEAVVTPIVESTTPVVESVIEPAVKEVKKFASDDMIQCKSLRYGTLLHISKKTGNAYEWSDYGDIVEVAYTDLLAMKSSKSKFIYAPWMVILDEDAIAALNLTDVYKKFEEYEDIDDFFNQSPAEIKIKLQDAPTGFKDLIVYTAASMIREGSIDSIATVKAIDDVLKKNLSSLIGGN